MKNCVNSDYILIKMFKKPTPTCVHSLFHWKELLQTSDDHQSGNTPDSFLSFSLPLGPLDFLKSRNISLTYSQLV